MELAGRHLMSQGGGSQNTTDQYGLTSMGEATIPDLSA